MAENIYPIFERTLNREDKEKLLGQKSIVIWLVGLSGSGKSTIAKAFEDEMYGRGHLTELLDGDNLRSGINNNLSFSVEDRYENIRRTAEVAKLFLNCGVITLCSFITPTKDIRRMIDDILGENLFEVYVNCPLEVCEERDVKGLYKAARSGAIKNFTGITSPYEPPENPALSVKTENRDIEESVQEVYDFVIKKISYTKG